MTRRHAPDPTARLQRIRALSAELDVQRQTAVDRGKTQDSKASFVLVVVGLVASVASARLADSSLWVLALLPLIAALAAAAEAVVVLWPRSIKVVDASALTLAWVDSDQTQEQLEDYLLESKRKEILARDDRHRHSTPHLRSAFRLLIVSVAILFAVTIIDGFTHAPGEQTMTDSQTPTPPAAAMPSAAARPDTDATMQTLYATNPQHPKDEAHG